VVTPLTLRYFSVLAILVR